MKWSHVNHRSGEHQRVDTASRVLEKSHPLADIGVRFARNVIRPLVAVANDTLQMGNVVEVSCDLGRDGPQSFNDDVGNVVLERERVEARRRPADLVLTRSAERGRYFDQVGDAGPRGRVVADARSHVGDRLAEFFTHRVGRVGEQDARKTIRVGFAHLRRRITQTLDSLTTHCKSEKK